MPNKDGTGPQGQGPKTGRGMGSCQDNPEQGRGPGRGLGRNWCCFWRRGNRNQVSQQDNE